MYTVDDNYNDEYEEETNDESFWNNNHGLIIKIIIIILCVIVLFWLISALNNNSNTSDNCETHQNNVTKMRLASEKYFFINKNYNKTGVNTVTLSSLKSNNLINDLVDANNRVCNEYNSNTSLERDIGNYKMTINLSCSTNDKSEVFYYHGNTLACLNCNGETYMDGKTIPEDDDKDITPDPYEKYSCNSWSDWSTTRVSLPYLEERVRKLYKGIKYETIENITYSDWSEFSPNKVTPDDKTEVEEKIVSEEKWSIEKITTNRPTESEKLRIVSVNHISSGQSGCKSGYDEKDGKCYSKEEFVSDLTYSEFNSGKYQVNNGLCNGIRTEMNSEGKYEITYKGCRYNKITEKSKGSSYTEYVYQELEKVDTPYYRYRTKTIIEEKKEIITDKYYEENSLPSGYEKYIQSEKNEYSYKLSSCEK